ncbi:Ig-like domain-containing protein, partial [Limnohabitans sp.]|uniref:Ig-like domain-containing protein n=1 Tax=Limnohabitans sp. TaxID=1907725 RepID=UPI0037C09979
MTSYILEKSNISFKASHGAKAPSQAIAELNGAEGKQVTVVLAERGHSYKIVRSDTKEPVKPLKVIRAGKHLQVIFEEGDTLDLLDFFESEHGPSAEFVLYLNAPECPYVVIETTLDVPASAASAGNTSEVLWAADGAAARMCFYMPLPPDVPTAGEASLALVPSLGLMPGIASFAAIGAAARASAAADDAGGESNPGSGTVVSGRLVAGPVVQGHDLQMTLYDLAGNVLGTQRLDEQGFYAINIGSYLGGIVAMVSDGGINNVLDYFDEGMRAGKDLDAVLMAVEVVRSTNARVILNVNEATTAAAQLSGYNPNDGSGFVGGADPLATIELANAKVANVVQVTGSLTAADAQPLYNADGSLNGQMNMLGMFLASMSGMALLTPTTGDAIAAFAIGIQTSSTGPKLSDEAQAMVILGAVRSGISREEITNVLQPGSSDSAQSFVASPQAIQELTPTLAANLTEDQATEVRNSGQTLSPAVLMVLDAGRMSAYATASVKIANYAQDNGAAALTDASKTPVLVDYMALGVVGLGGANQPTVAMLNTALADPDVLGIMASHRVDVQAIVDAYAAVLTSADGTANNGAALPTRAHYALLGINGVETPAVEKLLGLVIDGKSRGDVDTVPKIQALALLVQKVLNGSASKAELESLGIPGVTSENLDAVLAALATATSVNQITQVLAAPTQTATITSVLDDVGTKTGALISGSDTDDTLLQITGTYSADLLAGAKVVLYSGATRLGPVTLDTGNRTWTYSNTSPFTSGQVVQLKAIVEGATLMQGTPSPVFIVNIDTTAPTLSSTAPSTSLTTLAGNAGNSAGEAITLTITFGEPVQGLTSGSNSTVFTVAGTGVDATWGGTNGSNTRTLTYTVQAGQNGQAAIDEAALKAALEAVITDVAGNPFSYSGNIANIDSIALPVIDTTAPSLVITDSEAGTANAPVLFNFSFSEAVADFELSKITITGGTAGALNQTSATQFSLVVTPNANSTTPITLSVAAGSVRDLQGNALAGTVSVSQAVNTVFDANNPAPVADTTAPSLVITDSEAG